MDLGDLIAQNVDLQKGQEKNSRSQSPNVTAMAIEYESCQIHTRAATINPKLDGTARMGDMMTSGTMRLI